MAASGLKSFVQQLRRLAGERKTSARTDAELLARFAVSREEPAFEEIVQRHGPLVWAICRTNLSAADADDAFQATFLVLARRANSIRKPASLAAWLSGVARKAVQSARLKQTRRREVPLNDDDYLTPSHDDDANDSRAAVAEEVERLPEKYRLPTLLCYVQGLTNEEAARRLGWPHGTVCGRLARARNLLRSRLTRRGLALTTPALVTGLGQPSSDLLAATFAQSVAASPKITVLKLAETVMNAMWLTKVKIVAASIVAVAALGAGTGWVMMPVVAQDKISSKPASAFIQPPAEIKPPEGLPEKIDEKFANEIVTKAIEMIEKMYQSAMVDAAVSDNPTHTLSKERRRAALAEIRKRFEVFNAGAKGGTIDILLGSIGRLYESELALSRNQRDKAKATLRAFSLAKAVVASNRWRYEVGQISQQDVEMSRFAMLDYQIKATEAMKGLEGFNPNMFGD